jgi:hypothetical protein
VAEFNASGTLLRRYVHGTSVNDPVIWFEGATIGALRFMHTNFIGYIVQDVWGLYWGPQVEISAKHR